MSRKTELVVLIAALILFSFACQVSLPNGYTISETQKGTPLPPTVQVYVQPTAMPVVPTATPEPPIELATPEPVQDTSTPEPTATIQPTDISHEVIPVSVLPTDKPQVVYDQESRLSAKRKEAYVGDEFLKGKYERPFDQSMEYLPYIDIIRTDFYRNIYGEHYLAAIYLQENPGLVPENVYGFGLEIDKDVDGRGDFLVWTKMPASTEWSVEGVTVWKDANLSVGGNLPMVSENLPTGDGYELKVFDAGVGTDPDYAWSRISPKDPKRIEIAFKHAVLEDSVKFMWASWAIMGPDQFGLFDHNDHFTYEAAGSPKKDDKKYYPLKEVYALDNTCRSASGFTARGDEPGLCPRPIQPTEESQNCHLEFHQCPVTHYDPNCQPFILVCD